MQLGDISTDVLRYKFIAMDADIVDSVISLTVWAAVNMLGKQPQIYFESYFSILGNISF